MSDTANFVQRGTDIMLGELYVSQVSHGPCTHLSPFAIEQRRTDSSGIPLFGTGVCRRVLGLPPHGEVVPDTPLAAGFSR